MTIFSGSGQQLAIDFDELRLSSGERARDIREPSHLYTKLKAEKIPGICYDMGTYDLMLALGRHRAANPPGPPIHKRQPDGDAAA